MNLTGEQIEFLTANENVILATCAQNQPRAIMVMPSLISAEQMILSNIQMEVSDKNIKANPNVFLVSYNRDCSKWLKISGEAAVCAEGHLFEKVKKLEKERCGLDVREIIVVTYKSVQSGEE